MRVVRSTRDTGILIVQPRGEMANIFGRLPGNPRGQHSKFEFGAGTIIELSDVGEHLDKRTVSMLNWLLFHL